MSYRSRNISYYRPVRHSGFRGYRGKSKRPSAYDEALRASSTVSMEEQDRRMEEIHQQQTNSCPSSLGHVKQNLAGHKLYGDTH